MFNYKFYHVLAIVLLTTSCGKQLDMLPGDAIIDEVAYTSLAGLEQGLTGAYSGINGTISNGIQITSLMTDEAMLPTENNTGRGVTTYRWEINASSADVGANWAGYYNVIDRVNRLLKGIAEYTPADQSETAAVSKIKGEALAIRAFSHFELIKNYAVDYNAASGGVPYMEQSVVSKPKRSTVGDVLTKVKADLNAAKVLIPVSASKNTRITVSGISAIQARIAMFEKKWDDAITYSTEVINANPLATIAQFPDVWTDLSEAGVVWKIKKEAGETRQGDFYYDRDQKKIIYAASKELRDLFDATNDVRYNAYIENLSATRFKVRKYTGGNTANPNVADVKVFRVAEMYLIRAEAYAEKDDLVNGTLDINTLRSNRIMGYTPVVFAGKNELIDAVMTERFKELAFEGHRYYDLRRKELSVTRIPDDAINALGAVTLTPDKKEYYLPIPNGEIQANENIEQHPKYQ